MEQSEFNKLKASICGNFCDTEKLAKKGDCRHCSLHRLAPDTPLIRFFKEKEKKKYGKAVKKTD